MHQSTLQLGHSWEALMTERLREVGAFVRYVDQWTKTEFVKLLTNKTGYVLLAVFGFFVVICFTWNAWRLNCKILQERVDLEVLFLLEICCHIVSETVNDDLYILQNLNLSFQSYCCHTTSMTSRFCLARIFNNWTDQNLVIHSPHPLVQLYLKPHFSLFDVIKFSLVSNSDCWTNYIFHPPKSEVFLTLYLVF